VQYIPAPLLALLCLAFLPLALVAAIREAHPLRLRRPGAARGRRSGRGPDAP
jgi:hypothetical protein